jgi:hypothetical protein
MLRDIGSSRTKVPVADAHRLQEGPSPDALEQAEHARKEAGDAEEPPGNRGPETPFIRTERERHTTGKHGGGLGLQ